MSNSLHSSKGKLKKCQNCKCFNCISNSGYLCKDCGHDTCYGCVDDGNKPYCNRDLKVYKMDDCEWWVTDKSLEETIDIYCNEYGINKDECDPEECDLDTDEMWVGATKDEIAYNEKLKPGEEPRIGVIGSFNDEICIFVSFREAIKRLKHEGVGCIATTEC